ncbi:MAG TPA: TonB family protein [Pyrinomonadaceae bacterium]|jgi:TonB family protein|nr:TonB family protein [Pyrinomonadaceae bacterium]
MKTLFCLIGSFCCLVSLVVCATAQDSRPPIIPSTDAAANHEPKGEVDQAIEELRKHGESVFKACGKCDDPKEQNPGGVINGRAVKLVTPEFPPAAVSAHAYGDVTVLVLMNKEGKIQAAQVESGHPLLRAAALKAAKASRFSPPLVDGKPQNIVGRIVYSFRPR